MSRTTSLTRRVFAGCLTVVAVVVLAVAILHAKGISFALTDTYFSFGRTVHAQDSMPAMQKARPAAALSTSLTVNVDGKSTKFTVAELKAMPQKTVKVHNEHANKDEMYTGVELADVLAKCGFVVGKTEHQQIVRSYLKAEGTDKYWVLYSALEVEPTEHSGDVIVATSMNGGAIGADGELKLVSTEDKKPQRWVRNLAAITLKTAE